MGKKTIQRVVIQCDYVNENGERCSHEGEKDKMGTCNVCGIDVCDSHFGMSYVTSRVISDSMLRAGQSRNAYCFCVEHIDSLLNFVVEKFGNEYEIPPNHYGGGVGETQVLETHNQFVLNKTSSSK